LTTVVQIGNRQSAIVNNKMLVLNAKTRSLIAPKRGNAGRLCVVVLTLLLVMGFVACGGGGGGGGTTPPPPVNNPVPTLSSISPTSAVAGEQGFTLTATGSNFISGSSVRWNGSSRTTTFISSTQLTAAISANDVASAGTAQVTVFNPTPGGGTSTAQTFTITAAEALALLTSRLPDSGGGKEYYFIPQDAGGVPPLSWSVSSGSLPPGLSIDQTSDETAGLISGTVGAVGTDTTYNFTLQVSDSASTPHIVTRALSIIVHAAGGMGRNDVCTAGTTAGTTQISNGRLRASISPYGDIDVYSFHGTAGSQVTIETFAARLNLYNDGVRDSYLDTVLELLDSNCNQIAINDDLPSGNSQDSLIQNFTLPATGTYFIRVRDWRGDGRPDLIYDLSLSGAD
jgi:hypothetical protein